MNTDAINDIRKAAEAAIEADQALTDSGTCDLGRLTVNAMNATRAMRDDLTPATVLELCRWAKIGEQVEMIRLGWASSYDACKDDIARDEFFDLVRGETK